MSAATYITEPRVHLIARKVGLITGEREFLLSQGVGTWETDATTSADALVELAGRACYNSFKTPRPGGNAVYVTHLLESGHGSVCEHASFTFAFTGVSRSLTHELVRHRAGYAYSQRSQRFVDESLTAFVLPPLLAELLAASPDSEAVANVIASWRSAVEASRLAYTGLVASLTAMVKRSTPTATRKAIREAARSVLPECTETVLIATANVRAWRHFLELRGSESADAEIRRLALAVLAVLQSEAPNLFADYVVETNDDGVNHVTTPYRKV